MEPNQNRRAPAQSNPAEAAGSTVRPSAPAREARRTATDPDEIGIPSGYLERTFESKRAPLPHRLRSDPSIE